MPPHMLHNGKNQGVNMHLRRRNFIACAAAFAVARPAFAAAPLSVVTTTAMIADAVRQVGGSHVEVKALMGPGIDPHAYRQTRTDLAALYRADGVFWNGLYLEAQMEELLLDLARRKPTFAVGDDVPKDKLLAHEDYEGRFDPHIWMVPDLWASVVESVRQRLSDLRPDSAPDFAANAARHSEELARLQAYADESLSQISEASRVLISAHDAFGYFGQAFGFDVMGIQGLSTQSEAGLNRIAELVDVIVTRDIKAVFVESSVSDRNMRALIEGAAARGHELAIGGELFSDAMGQPGTYEATYVGMIDHNVTVIASALGADVPRRGMNGLLAAGS